MLDIQAESEPYTVRVVVLTDLGIPLVADMGRRPYNRFWKFPGGGSKAKDRGNILRTARREVRGETNIEINLETSVCVARALHGNGHITYLVFDKVTGLVTVPRINPDDEMVKIYNTEELLQLIQRMQFLQAHLELLRKAPKDYQKLVLGVENA